MENILTLIRSNPWVASVAYAFCCFIVYFIGKNIIIVKFEKLAQRSKVEFDDKIIGFFKRFYGLIVFFILALGVIKIHQLEITPFLTGAGIIGAAIGFAAKESITDFLAGIFLLTDEPLKKGDRVKIEYIGRDWGAWGDVIFVGLRRTAIKNTDGVIVNYPNSTLARSVITNFSHNDEQAIRVRIRLLVDFNNNLEKVKDVITASIKEIDGIVEGSPYTVIRALSDDKAGHMVSGVLVEGRFKIKDIRKRTAVRSNALEKIHQNFKKNSIELSSHRISLNNTSIQN